MSEVLDQVFNIFNAYADADGILIHAGTLFLFFIAVCVNGACRMDDQRPHIADVCRIGGILQMVNQTECLFLAPGTERQDCTALAAELFLLVCMASRSASPRQVMYTFKDDVWDVIYRLNRRWNL